MPPRRSFGVNESALDDDNETPQYEQNAVRRILHRFSFGSSRHRPSFTARWRNNVDEEGGMVMPTSERPPIPTMMQPAGEAYTTPLPVLSMIVLSIVR